MRYFSTAGYKITRFSEFRICKLVFFCQFEHFLGQKWRILKKCVKCVKVCVLKTKADSWCVCWDHEKIENTTTLEIWQLPIYMSSKCQKGPEMIKNVCDHYTKIWIKYDVHFCTKQKFRYSWFFCYKNQVASLNIS